MIAVPAVDLREGCCVQLVGGRYDREAVRLANPASVAEHWSAEGFRRLHLVDLDAAMDLGSNYEIVRQITEMSVSDIQVGGGVRTSARVEDLVRLGASSVVVGTRAFEDRAWLVEIVDEFPGVIVVAVDVLERKVVTHGWKRDSGISVTEMIASLDELPLAGVLVTAVHREGKLEGPDLNLMSNVAKLCRHPLQGSGGIRSVEDLRALSSLGASSAVIGMALYTGALDARATAKEFDT